MESRKRYFEPSAPSQSPSVTAPPKGEPLAGRATSYCLPEARIWRKRAGAATEGRLVNFLHNAWLLRGMAYNKSTKDRSNVVHCSHQSERKPPPGVPAPKGGLLYLVLTAREPSVKPLADVVCSYLCKWLDCKNKIKKVFHYISSSPCQIRPG